MAKKINWSVNSLIVLIMFLSLNSCDEIKKLPYVTGIITHIELVNIPNKAMNKPEKQETRITLSLSTAFDEHGHSVSIETYDYPTFAGPSNLIDKFVPNQRVKIVCTSITGRRIESIDEID